MRHGKVFVWLACAATLGACATDAPPDPAQFASATTLSDAIARASSAYGVPREVLVAIAWTETRFGDPNARGDEIAVLDGGAAPRRHRHPPEGAGQR